MNGRHTRGGLLQISGDGVDLRIFWGEGGVEFSIPRFFWVGKFDKTSIFLDIQSNLKIRVSARV